MKRKPSSPNRQDVLWLFERLVKGPAEAGEDFVHRIPTSVALYVLELAKKAPGLRRGPRGDPHWVKTKEALVIRRARIRKRELQDGGLPAGDALIQAAKEASGGSRLSAAAIKDKMQRKKSRR